MTEENKIPVEQTEEFYGGCAISLQFLRRHLDVKPSEKMANALAEWVKKNTDGRWTEENLESAFAAIGDTLERGETEVEVLPKEEPKYAHLSKADVRSFTAAQMRERMKDPEFMAAVERLGIQGGRK